MTISPPVVLRGSQRPRILSVPPHRSSAGGEAVELAASAGVHLDPWQAYALECGLAETRPGKWAAFEVGITLARQNGKGEVLLARELAGLYLFGDRLIVHTAHEFRTAADGFRRIWQVVQNTPDLERLVAKVNTGHGTEGIELKNGCRLRFFARTGGAGRGFSGDVIILDEAYNLPDSAISALMPTMATRPNPQVWYTSSAVDQQNPSHQNGHVLSRIRRRGLKGDDPSLVYMEWSADADQYRNDNGVLRFDELDADQTAWAEANPALGIPQHGISSEHVERERRAMHPRSFAVERLSVGDWPSDDPDADAVINRERWQATVDEASALLDPVAFAVDMNPERTWVSIAAAGRRADGLAHVEVVERQAGTTWVIPRLVELVEKWSPTALALDPGSPAGSLLAGLADEGLDVMQVSGRELGQACGEFYDAATKDGLRHLDDSVLAEAVVAGRKRNVGTQGAWAWDRRDFTSDITPLVASTLALHAFLAAPSRSEPRVHDWPDDDVIAAWEAEE